MSSLHSLLCSLLLVLGGANAQPHYDRNMPGDLPNLHEVVPGKIYRSAQPTDVGLETAKANGIKKILDLRNEEPERILTEKAEVEKLGMKFISLPMRSLVEPTPESLDAILKIISDPANQPILVHCHHGQDRTGLVIGLYRVKVEGVSPAKAYLEMRTLGFHPQLVALHRAFIRNTGYHPWRWKKDL